MSLRDRRKKGVTFFAVLRSARKLANNPEFDPADKRECAEKILEDIIGKQLPQAMQDEPGIDWDGLLAFIEKILPLILQIISIL